MLQPGASSPIAHEMMVDIVRCAREIVSYIRMCVGNSMRAGAGGHENMKRPHKWAVGGPKPTRDDRFSAEVSKWAWMLFPTDEFPQVRGIQVLSDKETMERKSRMASGWTETSGEGADANVQVIEGVPEIYVPM